MTRSLLSIVLVIALLLTNAAGYHSHGTARGAGSHIETLTLDTSKDHHNQHADGNYLAQKQTSGHPSHTEKNGQGPSDIGDMHSHAYALSTFNTAPQLPNHITHLVTQFQEAFIIANSIKPPIKPPSRA